MTKIQHRRGTSSEWAAANPTLSAGEFGYDSTVKDFKMGDGSTPWATLPFEKALATSSVAGHMSAQDKAILDTLSGASVAQGDIVARNYVTNVLSSGNYSGGGGTGGAGTLTFQDVLANGKQGFVRFTQTTVGSTGSSIATFSGLTPKVVSLGDIVTVSGFVRTNKTGTTSIQVQTRYRNGSSATPQAAETITFTNVAANTWVPFVLTLDAASYTGDNVWLMASFSNSSGGTYPAVGQYLDLSALMINDGPKKADFYFDGRTPPPDVVNSDLYSVGFSGTVGNSVSYLYYKSNVVDRDVNGNYYSTAPKSPKAVANKEYVDEKFSVNKIKKQDRPIIGFTRSSPAFFGSHQFDETYTAENLLETHSDTVAWYHPINNDTAVNYTIEVLPELDSNPDRLLMWVMENWMLNQEFIDDFDAQGPQYKNLVNALTTLISGGHMDRIHIAPFHECNGPGGYPWQMYDADLFFWDYINSTPGYRSTQNVTTGSSIITNKGSVATFTALPSTGNTNGDAWFVTDTGKFYWYRNAIYNDMGIPKRMNTPALYASAFKKIVELARTMGYTGKFIQWFLMGNSTSSDTAAIQEDWNAGYVGDAWVDIVGVSHYNRYEKDAPGTWGEFATDIRRFSYRVGKYTNNPVWSCETGCYDSDPTDSRLNKGQWYSDIVKLCGSGDIPNYQGCIMFWESKDWVNAVPPVTDPAKQHDYYPENNEQFRMIGRAMVAARRGVNPVSRHRHNRNLLAPTVSIPASTAGWSGTNSVGISVVSAESPRFMDKGTTALHMSKSTSTADTTSYAVYRNMDTFHDYEPNQPYTLSFTARAGAEKYQLSAGIMTQTAGDFIGEDAIQLTTVWEEYKITFASKLTDSAGFRLPAFKIGANNSGGWVEVTDIKLEKGSYATPNSEKTRTPKVKGAYANAPASGSWWNCETGDIWTYTMITNRTLGIPDGTPFDGQEITIRLKQDATGTRTLTQSASFKSSSVSGTLATAAGAINALTYVYDASIAKWLLIRNISY